MDKTIGGGHYCGRCGTLNMNGAFPCSSDICIAARKDEMENQLPGIKLDTAETICPNCKRPDISGPFLCMSAGKVPENEVIRKAIECAVEWGGIDGAHHKDWTIDQIVRILAGDDYDKIVADACDGEDGPNTYSWDCGIAP